MKWVDSETAILKDTSFANFYENGEVELYPSIGWIKPRNKDKKGFGYCHTFNFKTKEQAIKVFTEIENNLK
jgi:hypothetical protein